MELGQIHPALAKDKISGMLASLVNRPVFGRASPSQVGPSGNRRLLHF
jgi:hypothetical protein